MEKKGLKMLDDYDTLHVNDRNNKKDKQRKIML